MVSNMMTKKEIWIKETVILNHLIKTNIRNREKLEQYCLKISFYCATIIKKRQKRQKRQYQSVQNEWNYSIL